MTSWVASSQSTPKKHENNFRRNRKKKKFSSQNFANFFVPDPIGFTPGTRRRFFQIMFGDEYFKPPNSLPRHPLFRFLFFFRINFSVQLFFSHSLPRHPFFQYYYLTAQTDYESAHVKLDMFNLRSETKAWSECVFFRALLFFFVFVKKKNPLNCFLSRRYFISVVIGTFDENCNLVGEELDLQNLSNDTDKAISVTTLPFLNVAANATFHLKFRLAMNRDWFQNSVLPRF